jgi:adenine-specific DNA-methyltransferase
VIKYLGSKRLLLPALRAAACQLAQPGQSALDLFSGTSRVGQEFKRAGFSVLSNDLNAYAATIARCYVQADAQTERSAAAEVLAVLAAAEPVSGYFTKTWCEESRFFHPDNGARIEGMRLRLAELNLAEPLHSVVLTSLMEAADRVDSTTGVQMAYLKSWAPRALKPIALRVPELIEGTGQVTQLDAALAAKQAGPVELAYLDPPYNQHSYVGNYHIWESLTLWDEPEVYGVACKRTDVRERKSPFNSKRKIHAAMAEVLDALDARTLLVSFNNEGYISEEEMIELLSPHGEVALTRFDYKRYVGAQIGVHNPKGERVGKVGHLRNRELLFAVAPNSRLAKVAVDAAEGAMA